MRALTTVSHPPRCIAGVRISRPASPRSLPLFALPPSRPLLDIPYLSSPPLPSHRLLYRKRRRPSSRSASLRDLPLGLSSTLPPSPARPSPATVISVSDAAVLPPAQPARVTSLSASPRHSLPLQPAPPQPPSSPSQTPPPFLMPSQPTRPPSLPSLVFFVKRRRLHSRAPSLSHTTPKSESLCLAPTLAQNSFRYRKGIRFVWADSQVH